MPIGERHEGVRRPSTRWAVGTTPEVYDKPKPLCRWSASSVSRSSTSRRSARCAAGQNGQDHGQKVLRAARESLSCTDGMPAGRTSSSGPNATAITGIDRGVQIAFRRKGVGTRSTAYACHSVRCPQVQRGAICDNGRGDDEKGCPDHSGGCSAVIIIFFVILPLCCIGCSVAACCFACQQNNRRPQARVQQQPVAYAAAQPAGGAVQMQQYGKQPYQTGPPQAPVVVQPTVVRVDQPTGALRRPAIDRRFDGGSPHRQSAPSPRMDLVKSGATRRG